MGSCPKSCSRCGMLNITNGMPHSCYLVWTSYLQAFFSQNDWILTAGSSQEWATAMLDFKLHIVVLSTWAVVPSHVLGLGCLTSPIQSKIQLAWWWHSNANVGPRFFDVFDWIWQFCRETKWQRVSLQEWATQMLCSKLHICVLSTSTVVPSHVPGLQ